MQRETEEGKAIGAHLGVLGGDLEHTEDDDEGDAVAGDDDDPRRSFTWRG